MKHVIALAALAGLLIAGCTSNSNRSRGGALDSQFTSGTLQGNSTSETQTSAPRAPSTTYPPQADPAPQPESILPAPSEILPDEGDSAPEFMLPLDRYRSYQI